MNPFQTLSRLLGYVERSLIVLLLGTMVILAFLQVILRNYFSTGLLWADPFLRHLVLWVGFLVASLATQQEKHIHIDIVTRFVTPRAANFIRIATHLFAAIVCTILVNSGWTFVRDEKGTGGVLITIGTLEFPAWWFQIIIPVGFALMAFRFLLRTIDGVVEAIRPPTNALKDTRSPGTGT